MRRRLVRALILALMLAVAAAAGAVVVSQTAWFKNWLRDYIVRGASQYLNGTLSIGHLDGNLFFGVNLEKIGVSMEGQPVLAIDGVRLDYNVFELVARGLSVTSLRIDRPVVHLRPAGEKGSLGRLLKNSPTDADRNGPTRRTEGDRSGPARPISIDDIAITGGRVVLDGAVPAAGVEVPKRLDQIDADFSFKYEPVRSSVRVSRLAFRTEQPSLTLASLSGGVSVDGDTLFVDKLVLRTTETSLSANGAVQHYLTEPVFNLQIGSDNVSLPELARIVPSLADIRLQAAFALKLDGPLDRLGVEMNAWASPAQLTGRLTLGLVGPNHSRQVSAAGDVSIRHLDLAPLLNDQKLQSDLTADTRLDVKMGDVGDPASLEGRLSLKAPEIALAQYRAGPIEISARGRDRAVDLTAAAVAYGGSLAANGRVTLPRPNDRDRPPLTVDLRGQVRRVDLRRLPRDWPIPRTPSELGADYHVVAHVPTDRRGSIGGAADARFVTSQIAGATIADGSTAGASWQNGELAYRADVTVAGVDLKRIGEAFSLPALESDQYSSAINGHIVADGHGTTPQALALTASGTLNDTEVIGARVPELAFDATIGHDMAHVKAGGTFENLDPARPTGKTALQGAVSGRLDLDATIEGFSQGVTVDNAAARARLDLGRSSVGGLDIDHATLDGSYERSTGEVRTLEIVGSDVNVSASGRLALDETGQSNLMVHADSSKLETIARLFDQPLTGMARVDSTVTGNRRELHASGTAATNDLDFQGSGALAASTEFTATLSDLDPETASITATTRATLVNIGGQHVNELTLETSYARRAVNFDASARQPERSVTGAGSLLFNPDGQEVQVKSLGFESRGVRWQTAAGGRPTVRYSGGKIAVDDLQLVNDNQRASVSGAFGAPGDTLNVTLADVDLSTVDALLLRPPQLTGRLNGSARISGTMNDPTVKAELKVADGGYGQIRYETLGATLIYGANGIDIDAQLQQNPTTSITVKGYAPLAASAVRPEFDIRVDSSPIDLGLFQELIPQVTNLKGTLQATVNVTGPFGDPRPLGAVTIGNAGFTVPLTGAAYSELGGRIDFQPDKVHIGELRVLDNQRHALTVTGDLALREREVGGVAIEVTSKDFKIIDNKMGNARIDSSLRIAGELMAARIEGDLKVATGQLNLDPILALVADRAYATQETSLTADAGVDQTQAPSAFDALAMYVRFQVPNDLVIKASDVKVPGSPIGLGGLNVTVGSDLFLNKSPWDQFRLIGTVNTVRGTYDFQGRRFTILRDGKIRFQGLDEFDAGLDIRAERVIQAVTATINVRGTLRQPELALSSVPPLEEADILSLIVFNQPINQLGTGQQASLAASAQAMALGAAAGQVSQSIGKALGLDTFEVNLAPETGATPEVTIGQQVGQNLYLKVQQGIGDQGQTNVILEYELTRWLRFRTNYLQGPTSQAQLFQRLQGSGLDLLFFFSF